MDYEITVTVGDHSPQVDVSGTPPHGTYVVTGREDETVDGLAPSRQPDDGRPKVQYQTLTSEGN